jgi:hypothetical protein
MIDESLYCKVHLDCGLEPAELLSWLQNLLGASLELRTLTAVDVKVDVGTNDEYDSALAQRGIDQFLHYRYLLDVVPGGPSRERYVACVAALLEAAWNANMRAIASCDFESELPRSGGIAALRTS